MDHRASVHEWVIAVLVEASDLVRPCAALTASQLASSPPVTASQPSLPVR